MRKIAPVFILLSGILWGCLGVFVRNLNSQGLFSMQIVFLRAIVACGFMGLVLVLSDRKLFVVCFKDIWCFIGTGICSIVFFNYCYFKAISMISLSIAAVLLYTAPAMVMVMSYFLFKEQFTKRKVTALILTFIGCGLVTGVITNPGNITPAGVLTGLGAGFGYALYSIFGRYAIQKGYHTMTITFYTFLIAAAATFFFVDVPQIYTTVTQSRETFWFCIALGILCTVLPYLIYTLGLQYVDNSKASIIASVEPVTAAVVGILLFGEKMDIAELSGMMLVLLSLLICNRKDNK
ncbi:MAG: DMT family transporter [Oliverpabstia sp.]